MMEDASPASELDTGDYQPISGTGGFPTSGHGVDDLGGITVRTGFRFSRKLALLADQTSPQSESISALRAHLLAQHVRNGRRSLAICAPSIGSGSTYIAANLAFAFAQAGINTLLIDANMRDPGVQGYIQPPEEPTGLRQCLSETQQTYTNAIHEDVLDNLSVLYAGGATSNSQELLASKEFKSLMDNCMRDYDMTIVDTPPGISAADNLRIAMVVGYVLVVARRNDSLVADLRALMDGLIADRVRIVGTFLNDY